MFEWLGRKAASGSPAAARFPAMILGMDEAEPPRGYRAQAKAALERNPVASRAIRLFATAVGECPLRIEGPDALAALLAQPNGRDDGTAFFERLGAHLLLHGNAYVEAATDGAGRPAELHVLAPDRMRIETDRAGWPNGYLYRAGDREVRLPVPSAEAAGLLHIRALSPLDDHYGLGALSAAAGAIEAHEQAAKWNRALLKNAARPSGALVFGARDGEALSADQYERLRGELDAGFSGANRAGRPLLLEGGLSWQPLSMSPADLDFAEGQKLAAREIALALGVPPLLLGMPGDNTYANYAEANRALWRQSVIPMAGRIGGALSGWLAHWWPDARIAPDENRVAALAPDRAALWAQVSAADFLSPEEKRALLGLGAEGAAGVS
ncbi:MAG: phage portal protein [Pacificimonas sp.]|jgi:HK97 family phage portal protein|nr:phage portal protein [Pacificimonas sp.]